MSALFRILFKMIQSMIYRQDGKGTSTSKDNYFYARDSCGLRFHCLTSNHLMYVVSKALLNNRLCVTVLTTTIWLKLHYFLWSQYRKFWNGLYILIVVFWICPHNLAVTLSWVMLSSVCLSMSGSSQSCLPNPCHKGSPCRYHGLYDRKYQLISCSCSTLIASV